MRKQMTETTVYGRVELDWNRPVILPLDRAAQLIELLAEGLHRENGNYPERGVVKTSEIPHMQVLTGVQYQALRVQGNRNQAEAEAAEKARLAEAELPLRAAAE